MPRREGSPRRAADEDPFNNFNRSPFHQQQQEDPEDWRTACEDWERTYALAAAQQQQQQQAAQARADREAAEQQARAEEEHRRAREAEQWRIPAADPGARNFIQNIMGSGNPFAQEPDPIAEFRMTEEQRAEQERMQRQRDEERENRANRNARQEAEREKLFYEMEQMREGTGTRGRGGRGDGYGRPRRGY
ncbi:hypothetical protein BJ508DRAFT_335109 [Ascobolus immersus RN42]|uniref:Uncharacterized protein n=1 Tax=Ascobolus immersus RN42 TaxID=1160509 RepID=A0A3N4HFJ5_ASCIM|nr:hypothetical protein BJ508DRAFT_335109 [Ascobolus immersus RN42]